MEDVVKLCCMNCGRVCCSSTTILKGASQQENLVYQIIQDAGNKGGITWLLAVQQRIPLICLLKATARVAA